MTEVSKGDTVQVHYTGTFEDGSEFDTSRESEPLEFVAGSDEVIEGFSNAVIGMKTGDKKQFTLPPDLAYGPHDDRLVYEVPLDKLPEKLEVGDQLSAQVGEHAMPFWVSDVTDSQATLDGNHPMAGKTLNFDIELVAVNGG